MIWQTLALTAGLALWAAVSDAASLRRRPRASHHRSPRTLPSFGGWRCPALTCPDIHEDCDVMEVIAFSFAGGECLSCPYCIDVPDHFYDVTRDKRSAPEVEDMDEVLPLDFRFRRSARQARLQSTPVIQNQLCEHVTCPVSPPGGSCRHPGMLDGYLRGHACIRCPACLDDDHRK